jgi:hypothetical protein
VDGMVVFFFTTTPLRRFLFHDHPTSSFSFSRPPHFVVFFFTTTPLRCFLFHDHPTSL